MNKPRNGFSWALRLICLLCVVGMGFMTIVATGGGSGGDDSGRNGDVSRLSRMDLSGAKALLIASKQTQETLTAQAISDSSDVLYKLTDEGLLIEVKFYDDSGNEVSSATYLPEYIEDINDDYVFMKFGGGPWPPQYIVQKSTGSAFQMRNEAVPYYDVLQTRHYFHSEVSGDTHDGNAYYLWPDHDLNRNALRRIEFDTSGILTDTRISPEGDNPTHDEALGPKTAIAADGTIFYDDFSKSRLISSDGRVLDLTQEIITNQPEMRAFILGEIPGYMGGLGQPFVGTDGAIYFMNDDLLNYLRDELYFVPQYPDGSFPDFPPDPSGPTILVYTESGESHVPYNPYTGLPVNLRDPIGITEGVDWWNIDYIFPDDWDWYPESYESTFDQEILADEAGNSGWRYDEFGNRYRWHWYDGEIYSPVWRLSSTEDGDFHLKPYGNAMATSSRWLVDKASNGFLYYDSTIDEQKAYWWEIDNPLILRCDGKIIAVEVGKGLVYEANNPTDRAKPVVSASEIFSEVQDAEATADYYYLLGRTNDDAQISLYRFDADTHSSFELINGSEYELYTFTVISDNTVVFKAVRRSDGASIGGTINLAGEITIIEAIQDRDVVQLERVL